MVCPRANPKIFRANILLKFPQRKLLFDNETGERQIHCLNLSEKLPPKGWLSKNFWIYSRKSRNLTVFADSINTNPFFTMTADEDPRMRWEQQKFWSQDWRFRQKGGGELGAGKQRIAAGRWRSLLGSLHFAAPPPPCLEMRSCVSKTRFSSLEILITSDPQRPKAYITFP